MIKTRNNKYKNLNYNEEIENLLQITLSSADKKKLHKVYSNYYSLDSNRVYEEFIDDLYILVKKRNLTTEQLSKIYNVNIRVIQQWLKELGLNRSIKEAKKLASKAPSIENLEMKTEITDTNINKNRFGISISTGNEMPKSLIDFINYLQTIKGKSENTIDGYKRDLTIFFRFIKVYKGFHIPDDITFDEIQISDITDDTLRNITLPDLYAFMSFVEQERENGAYARARKVATLKSFFKFLQGKAKVINENPTLELESPKISKRHPVYLTLEESISLLSSLDKTNSNYFRDYCILMLFLNCGMRLSELCSIKINKIKGDTLTIIGKGNKERTVYLNDACLNSIENYLKVRDSSKANFEDKEYLFLSSRNKPISKRSVELLVKKHISNAGVVGDKYSPHKLRHTAATLMYKHGNVDIRSLQNILGHENISTTQIYTHVDDDALREAVKSNPLSKIK